MSNLVGLELASVQKIYPLGIRVRCPSCEQSYQDMAMVSEEFLFDSKALKSYIASAKKSIWERIILPHLPLCGGKP